MSPTSYQAALPRVIPSLLSATLIIIPYSNGFVKRVRKVFFAAEAEDENAAADLLSRKPAATPIHAPPRGATIPRTERPDLELISIHAPPRGATNPWIILARRPNISIHAPPRGATTVAEAYKAAMHFNSRPSARGDSKRYAISANLLFNPYKSAWLNNRATQFVEIILVIFHRIIA